MGKIYRSITELVGKTPLLELANYEKKHDLPAKLLVKLEYFNPNQSIKDRAALNMIEEAEKKGLIKPGDTLVETTSGNTGIGLAAIAATKGYKFRVYIQDQVSAERFQVIKAFGAEVIKLSEEPVIVETMEKTGGDFIAAVAALRDHVLAKEEGIFFVDQLSNPANPAVHESTTGPEIWEDTDGQVDVFISGVGTGGTLTGVSRYIKGTKGKKELITVAVEPTDSPVITQALAGEELKPGPHKIQGIGAGFIPGNLDLKLIDKVVTITNEEAISTARRLMDEEGILAGISSGAAVAAALKLQEDEAFTNKNIVVILPSSGERYLSTALFADLFTEKELQQ